MAWPNINWDAIPTVDMAEAIASLWVATNQRRMRLYTESVLQETVPTASFSYTPDRQVFKKEDGGATLTPSIIDAIMPFNNPLQAGGGNINYNLYTISNYINAAWRGYLGLDLFDRMDRFFPTSPRAYKYYFTDTLGGTRWTATSIALALSLDSSFFLNKDINTSIMTANIWRDIKVFINSLVFVDQYRFENPIETFIQSIDLRPYLTDQT